MQLKIVAKTPKKEYNSMSRLEKEIERLKSKPKDYTYEEAKSLFNKLGYIENNKGKTSGSRVIFRNDKGEKIELHKQHPKNILKPYQIAIIVKSLKEWENL